MAENNMPESAELKMWQDRACNNLHEKMVAERALANLKYEHANVLRSIREHGTLILELKASRAVDLEALDETKQFHAFLHWANEDGQDIAYTYDTERSKWVCLNPMTADLWKSWSACAALLRERLSAASLALHREGGGE